MYFGTPCYRKPLNCLFVYLVIPGTRPLFKRKQKIFIYLHATSKNEMHICSNKHETGLVAIKESKGAKIRNRYNQVPHLIQVTNEKVTNSQ